MADSDWKYTLEDLEFEEEDAGIEPGTPSAEGVFFVLLGAAATVASVATVFLP